MPRVPAQYPMAELGRYLMGAFLFSWVFFITAAWGSHAFVDFPTKPIATLGIVGPAGTALVLTRRNSRQAWNDFMSRAFRGWRLSPPLWVAIPAMGLLPYVLAKLAPIGDSEIVSIGLASVGAVIVGGVVPGFGEEFGWRGYALDRLQARWSPVTATLLLALTWATWHAPLFFVEGWYYHDELGLGLAWVFAAWILGMSLILTAAYNLTRRGILAVALLHTASNMGFAIFEPSAGEFAVVAASLTTIGLLIAVRMPDKTSVTATPSVGPEEGIHELDRQSA